MPTSTAPEAVQKTLVHTQKFATDTWGYFNQTEPEPEEGTFALMAPKPPANFFMRLVSAIPGAFIRAGTEGLYNADQIVFTPIRTWSFIAAGLAAVAAGTASVLSVTALNGIPLLGIMVFIPAVVLVVASLFRAISIKPKDIVSQFRKLYPETSVVIKFEVKVGDHTVTEARLFAATVRAVTKGTETKYFLSACYELSHDGSQKAFISNFSLSVENYNAYLALDKDGQQAQVITWLIEKARITELNQRATTEQNKARAARSEGWLNFLIFRIQSLWNKHYKGMSRFQIIRESLWVPFKFVFSGAMVYWSIWLCDTLIAGSSVGPGVLFVPFASNFIAFGIPLIVAIVLAVARAVVAYQQQDVLKNYDATKNIAEMLFQEAAAKKLADEQFRIAENVNHQRDRFLQSLRTVPSLTEAGQPTTLARLWNNFWYSLATLFITDYSIRNMLNSTRAGSLLRITVNTIVRFATGFILAFISLWPVFDYLTTLGGLPGTLGLIQFGVSLFSGFCFAAYAAYTKTTEENDRFAKFDEIKHKTPLFTRLLALEEQLIANRAELATLRKSATQSFTNEYSTQVAQRVNKLANQAHFNLFQRWWNYSTLVKQAEEAIEAGLGCEGLFTKPLSVVAHDEWEFTGKFNLEQKTPSVTLWTFAKRLYDRANEFVAAAGSGGLMVRLAFGAGTLLYGAHWLGGAATPLGFGTSIIIAIAVLGLVWGTTRLFRMLDSKNVRAAKQFAERGPATAEQNMIAELLYLEVTKRRLNAANARLTPVTNIAQTLEGITPAVGLSSVLSPPAPEGANPLAGASGEENRSGSTPTTAAGMFGGDTPAHSRVKTPPPTPAEPPRDSAGIITAREGKREGEGEGEGVGAFAPT